MSRTSSCPPVKRYSNHEYDYVQASQESDEFSQALIEGYEIVNPNVPNGYYILKKKKG